MDKNEFRKFSNGICLIKLANGSCGTGFYYGSDWIVTCAHVLRIENDYQNNVTFIFPDIYRPSADPTRTFEKCEKIEICGEIRSFFIKKIALGEKPDAQNYDIAFIQLPEDERVMEDIFVECVSNWFVDNFSEMKVGDVVRAKYALYDRVQTVDTVMTKVSADAEMSVKNYSIEPIRNSESSPILPPGSSGCPIFKAHDDESGDRIWHLVGLHYAGNDNVDLVVDLKNAIIKGAEAATSLASLEDVFCNGNFDFCSTDSGRVPLSDSERHDILTKLIELIQENNAHVRLGDKEANRTLQWARYVCRNKPLLIVRKQQETTEEEACAVSRLQRWINSGSMLPEILQDLETDTSNMIAAVNKAIRSSIHLVNGKTAIFVHTMERDSEALHEHPELVVKVLSQLETVLRTQP